MLAGANAGYLVGIAGRFGIYDRQDVSTVPLGTFRVHAVAACQ